MAPKRMLTGDALNRTVLAVPAEKPSGAYVFPSRGTVTQQIRYSADEAAQGEQSAAGSCTPALSVDLLKNFLVIQRVSPTWDFVFSFRS